MNNDSNAKLISAVVTTLIAVALFLFLYMCPLTTVVRDAQPREKAEIVLVDEEPEEFVEIIEPDILPPAIGEQPQQAQTPEPADVNATPAPASGTDLADRGPQGERPPVVTAKEPSPVKEKNETPAKPQGQVNKPKDEDQSVRRQAQNDVSNAFSRGKNNASATSSSNDTGNTGTAGAPSAGTVSVSGLSGTGWIAPSYGHIKSPVTGKINMMVKFDSTGRVTSVEMLGGGDPPAATNTAVINAVKRELSSKKFTRSSYDGAQPGTAYITVIFK